MKYSIAISNDVTSTLSLPLVIFANITDTQVTARVTKTQCLDGSVSVVNLGTYAVDKDFSIKYDMSKQQYDLIYSLMLNSTAHNISCVDGFFSGVISSLTPTSITFLTSERCDV